MTATGIADGAVLETDAVLHAGLAETFGDSWQHPGADRDVCEALRESYRQIGADYKEFPAPYYHYRCEEEAAAYALGYMPRYVVKAERALRAAHWGQDPTGVTRILDLGSGPGTISLAATGLLNHFARTASATRTVSLTLIDRSSAMLGLARRIVQAQKETLEQADTVGAQVATIEAFQLDFRADETLQRLLVGERYDLVAFGNCLSEICHRSLPLTVWSAHVAALVSSYANLLTDRGHILVIEPALRSVLPGLSEAKEILQKHTGLRCVIASEVERLRDEPEALTSPLAREVLGERVLRPLEHGSPYTYLVFGRDRSPIERRPPAPFVAVS